MRQPQHLGMLEIWSGSYEESGLHTQLVCFKAQILVAVFIATIYTTVFTLEDDLLNRASAKRTCPQTYFLTSSRTEEGTRGFFF